jgi:hypothetical protein
MTLNLFPGGFSIEGHHEGHPFDHTLKAFLRSLGPCSLPPLSRPHKISFPSAARLAIRRHGLIRRRAVAGARPARFARKQPW